MPFSMSQASVGVFEVGLGALSAILDKAAAHVAAKKSDPSALLHSRLAPDMFDLTRQIQVATDHAKRGSARLAGVEAPGYEDNETTIDQLKARVAKTLAFIKTLDRKQIDGAADREITVSARRPLRPDEWRRLPQPSAAAELLFSSDDGLRPFAPGRAGDRQARLLGTIPLKFV